MRSLSQIIVLLLFTMSLFAQSPHGDGLTIKCEECHNPNGWKLVKGTYTFDHNKATSFPLEGQHQSLDCKSCHTSLIFSKVQPDCASCHTDIHEQTVGFDCQRCHNPKSWIVNNIIDIHRHSRFPLLGPHATADCQECHKSASLLKFEPLGVECYDCHQQDYESAKNPDHLAGNYSTNCVECHNMNVFSWTGSNFNHSFFPLTEGHAVNDCKQCHKSNDYTDISSDCISCHQSDYNATSNPNHIQADISINCNECHTTKPGWKPAEFKQHDAQYFPIYSGKHNNEWDNCSDCHSNPSNYAVFSCINCHNNPGELADEHKEVGGYQYTDAACLDCHPQGSAEDGFDHNMTNFPLTGAHTTIDCASCHADGFQGTPTDCFSCHEPDYNQSVNPNHIELDLAAECETCHTTAPDWQPATFDIHNDFYFLSGGHAIIANDCFSCHQGDYNNTPNTCTECHIADYNQTTNPNHSGIGLSNVCDVCHTTDPEWKPAQFPVHDEYYVLEGAHATIASDCNTCHNGDYNNTPNTCVGCHLQDYNQTTDPPHESSGFSTECETCHNSTAWSPSTFDHDGQYFPIYSGKHQGEWESCNECHTTPNNFQAFSCIDCHAHNDQAQLDEEHQGIGGYAYNSDACYVCHPTGNAEDGFNHNLTNFPLTGAHLTVDCMSCHEDGFAGTTTICFDCHTDAYNESNNPDHLAINIPNVCDDCHTTTPGWQPAEFPIHNDYYELQGAHVNIDCASCHEGNYNDTPNTCFGCHESDYNQTDNPPHESAQFPTECETCHTQNEWVPSTFDHDGQYFPIYSGKHNNKWDLCSDCHVDAGNYLVFSCLTCHLQPETDGEHEGVNGYSYNSDACYACHPTGNGDDSFNHNLTDFPLTGAHIGVDCIDCHEDGYEGTTMVCFDCHTTAYNETDNPDHLAINIPNVCNDCHTTAPGWTPADFPIHDDYYELVGEHVNVDCASCHDGDYNETPNTCSECHISNYNEAANPDHIALDIPTTCEDCHTPSPDWQPAEFPIHDDYYELTGAHLSVDCASCHDGDYNETPNTCSECHISNYNESTNPVHTALNIPTTCEDCHTTNPNWEPAEFPMHDDYYELTGAHVNVDCASCHDGDYTETPNTCFGCHESDYNQTTDPPHLSAQFPTDCEMCHTTVEWDPSTFDHDNQYFPIYSGQHNGEWNTCNECHTTPGNYQVFDCINCHTNAHHQDQGNQGCYDCHPDGNEGDKKYKSVINKSIR